MERITIDEAQAAGKKRYFTGVPCPKGHTAQRYVANRKCAVCEKDKTAQWLKDNPKKAGQYSRKRQNLPAHTRPMPDACECCGRKQKRELSLDHCHVTGRFRGWLCAECNLGLGKLGDSIYGLMMAVNYLLR